MNKRFLALIFLFAAFGGAAFFLFFDARTDVENQEILTPDVPTAQLSGRVVDASHRPIAEAYVFVGEQAAKTNREGRFTFSRLPAGEHPVDASAEGFVRPGSGALGRTTVTVRQGQVADDLTLMLQRKAELSGTIVAGTTPVEGATLSLSYAYAEGLDTRPLDPFIVSELATSESNGSFTFENIAPGRMQVLVDSPDHPFVESREVFIRPGQSVSGFVIDIAPRASLGGLVTDEDGYGVNARLTLTSAETGHSWSVSTETDGYYRLGSLASGHYTLRVEAPYFAPEVFEDIFIEEDEELTKNITLGSVRGLIGRVTFLGRPVPHARVVARGADGQTRRIQADEEGRFQWAEAPSGVWMVRAFSPAHEPSREERARLGQETRLELGTGGTIRAVVVDSNRRPVSDFTVGVAFVELRTDTEHNHRYMPTKTISDPRGRFDYGTFPSGRYRLVIDAPGYALHTTDPIEVLGGSTVGPVLITLSEGTLVTGIVLDSETNEPISGAMVQHSGARPNGAPLVVYTDSRGEFEFQDLPGGTQGFRVSREGYTTHFFNPPIPDAGEADLEFAIDPVGDGPRGFSFGGIGATLTRDEMGVLVRGLTDDSAAGRAGVEVGDYVLAVDGVLVDHLTLDQVIERIRGESGQAVTLEVERHGNVITLDIERERVFISQERRRR